MDDFIYKNKTLIDKLDEFIDSSNKCEDDLIDILHFSQNLFGFVPTELQIYISKKLSLSLDKISSIVNFYSYFNTELEGKFKISVCLGKACSNAGSAKILQEFENILNIKSGQTTSDLKFTLQSNRCLGICRRPPIVAINGKTYEDVTLAHIPQILDDCK